MTERTQRLLWRVGLLILTAAMLAWATTRIGGTGAGLAEPRGGVHHEE